MAKLITRHISWRFTAGDCVLQLTALVTFNRPFWSKYAKKYINQKEFTYGVSRGCLPSNITKEQFTEKGMEEIKNQLKNYMAQVRKDEEDSQPI